MAHTLSPYRNENLREPGSIKFVGWKNMFIRMPNYIKQAVNYKPELATLSLTKIVFTTHPAEIVSDFFIYVDHLKVLSDMHESNFDGFGPVVNPEGRRDLGIGGNNMKRITIILLVLACAATGLYAQQETDPESTGIVTAQQKLKEISVTKMEDSGFWYGIFPADNGLIEMRAFPGGPEGKEPIEDEEQYGIGEADENVVGAKVSFYRRGVHDFTIKPIRPLPIEGITKTLSIWVAGRNTNHMLELLVSDHFGNDAVIPMGKLNFAGWKKLTVTIPPHIKQRDYHL